MHAAAEQDEKRRMQGKMAMILRNFIVFEGIDGAGTSTQIEMLMNSPHARKFFPTAEPTNGETGRFLRRMLGGEFRLDPRTAAYLFAADRCEHLWGTGGDDFNGGIERICAGGKIVVSDRYLFSSIAYQSVTCGGELAKILQAPFPLPELLFFFKIAPEVSLSRIGGRGKREIYEEVEFLRKTEERYERAISEFEGTGMKIVTIDAAKTKEEVAAEIIGAISDAGMLER